MLSLFDRLWRLFGIRASKAIEQFESPEEQLELFLSDLTTQVQDMQDAVTHAVADEKRLRRGVEDRMSVRTEWETRAKLALQHGEEELAKEALVKQEECDHELLTLKTQWEKQVSAVKELKTSLNAARLKVQEAKRDHNIVLARYRTAETTRNIQKTISATSEASPANYMAQLEDKIIQMEAETETELELLQSGSASDLDSEFRQLEQRTRGDRALEELKEVLQLESGSAETPSSGTEKRKEIEELKAALRS